MENSNHQKLSDREHFVTELSSAQSLLYRYIFSLLPNPGTADDVLQETNLALWRKADEFDRSREFMPWARTIARYQVLASCRDQKRDRIVLDENLVNLLADEIESDSPPARPRISALEHYLALLTADKRELILRRYSRSTSIEEIANSLNRPVASLSQSLYRIRQTLMKCVEKQLIKPS
jgi:RNA polymerase sigma-70 factor (ECF subfamily)